jgi:hypothetical protein
MYSFIPLKSFVPFHVAMATGACILSAKIQQKLDSSARLSRTEEDMVRAQIEATQDLAMDPSERRRGVVDFVEGYETLTLQEVEEVLVEECIATNDRTAAKNKEDGSDYDEDVMEAEATIKKEFYDDDEEKNEDDDKRATTVFVGHRNDREIGDNEGTDVVAM